MKFGRRKTKPERRRKTNAKTNEGMNESICNMEPENVLMPVVCVCVCMYAGCVSRALVLFAVAAASIGNARLFMQIEARTHQSPCQSTAMRAYIFDIRLLFRFIVFFRCAAAAATLFTLPHPRQSARMCFRLLFSRTNPTRVDD